MTLQQLSPSQIERIAQILGDTFKGFSGSEIGHHLAQCQIADPDPGMTKWRRLFNAFCEAVNSHQGSTNEVYKFLLYCFEPVQGLKNPDRYNWMRFEVNSVLMLSGVEIRDDGKFYSTSKAESLTEVQQRTKALRDKLTGYGAHGRVLGCCKEELLAEDYFHAVLEAAKSQCDKVRELTGLSTDGSALFEMALSNSTPYLLFGNPLTQTGRNQQNGLKEMLCGVIHMVLKHLRLAVRRELKARWDMEKCWI